MHSSLLLNPLQLIGMLPDRPSFEESLIFQMTGLIVVFTALGMIWLCLTLVGQYFKRTAQAPTEVPVANTESAPTPGSSDLTPELVAVIAASVQATVDSPLRIQAIVPVRSGQWATEGRRRIFSSHTVR